MEQLSSCITDRMIEFNIISIDDREYYCYSVQVLVERTIGIMLILMSAMVFHSLLDVSAFLCVFVLIRRNTDGFHCKTSIGCFCVSTIMALSTIPVAGFIMGNSIASILIAIVSVAVICIIATFNNPDMSFTSCELKHLKARSRVTTLIVGIAITTALIVFPNNKIVSFMALGLIYNALSLLIAILKERRNEL